MIDKTEAADVAVRGRGAVAKIRVVEPVAEGARIAEEQLAYAQVLDTGMKVGFLVLVASFAVYVSGLVSPHVPVTDLPRYWTLPVKEYLAATGIQGGWSWVAMLGKGDFMNFVGIALLSSVAIVCYAAITPIFFRKQDRIYAALAVAEVAVLVLAASGILKTGGH